ncbi:alpha-N-acetylglucosaminidase [Pedobacter sp. MC2016-05]|uniref:alpha-N-acetylglucosaminidase n=1 Tax=Pedobacter sp. MC2016-05 TaxID=2994474 RepID=UPI002245618E|nr:alpha-N-acetylglucosaminidase [Pedobacter sp. MC2016-05]MCX2476992.1 alpha-N-acetylglucosaminidase [Pedobacter sp. MC2016-05]
MIRFTYTKICLVFIILCTTFLTSSASPIEDLAKRIAKPYSKNIKFEQSQVSNAKDFFELESKDGKLIIKGNSYNSMAYGLNHYLKYYCNTSVSWYKDDVIDLPKQMPVLSLKINQEARVKNRFFLNYCTFGYTMPWWDWQDWEHLIDWMALNGINMPLSITGQEAIWYKVWSKMGLSDQEIRSYFTGPAFLPWHRMSNIDHWDGPLPKSWLDNQLELQKKIVKRERELNMKPILPAFAGHVPEILKSKYPNAKINDLGTWGGFSKEYYSNFLDPLDPLFKQIQTAFLEEQTKEFGTDHIYGADPFNEVTPPSWDPKYLASASDVIYSSMKAVDPAAEWLQMTWVFYYMRKEWTNERIKAYLKAVPQGKMTLLDYYGEKTEVWKLTESYFNQPYIWCYLGNFGGNSMMVGNLQTVEERMENAFMNGGANLTGIGSTLEGFDVNPMMYDYVFEKAWSNGKTDVAQWTDKWADRRLGTTDNSNMNAWKSLVNDVYNKPTQLGQGILINAKPSLKGTAHWTPNPNYSYSNKTLLQIWEQLLDSKSKRNQSSNYDAVNVGWQLLGNHFKSLRDDFNATYEKRDTVNMKIKQDQMLTVIDDVDRLLATQPSMLLGKWIENARKLGKNEAERAYYEKDAKLLITVWGGNQRSLNDYANRSWAGLTGDFYKKRWQMFFDEIFLSVRNGSKFDDKQFKKKTHQFEDKWVLERKKFPTKTEGNSFEVCMELLNKYASAIK